MESILALLDVGQGIAVAVLVWRSIVADRERAVLLKRLELNQVYVETVVNKLLEKTNI